MIKKLLSIILLMLQAIFMYYPEIQPQLKGKIVEIEELPNDDESIAKIAAEGFWESREFEKSMDYINQLWNSGNDDPYYDLLACCNYNGLHIYDKSIAYGLKGFEKLDWQIDQDIPSLYSGFMWCDVLWCMGGSYLYSGQFKEAIPYLEKFLKLETDWNNGKVYALEEKLILLYRLEYCYRIMEETKKADQIILMVKNSDEYEKAVNYWEKTGTTDIGNDAPVYFYHYAKDYPIE